VGTLGSVVARRSRLPKAVLQQTTQEFLLLSQFRYMFGIRPDKSASRLMSAPYLAYTALLVQLQSLALQKSRTRKFAPAGGARSPVIPHIIKP